METLTGRPVCSASPPCATLSITMVFNTFLQSISMKYVESAPSGAHQYRTKQEPLAWPQGELSTGGGRAGAHEHSGPVLGPPVRSGRVAGAGFRAGGRNPNPAGRFLRPRAPRALRVCGARERRCRAAQGPGQPGRAGGAARGMRACGRAPGHGARRPGRGRRRARAHSQQGAHHDL